MDLSVHATSYYDSHAAQYAASLDHVVPWAKTTTGYHPHRAQLADVQDGYYAAVQNLARLSYQAIIAATFVVFPLVSRSTFTDDQETTRRYIEVTSRYSLMFAMAIAVVMAANPVDVLGLVYAPDYAAIGGPALALLGARQRRVQRVRDRGTILNGAGLTRDAHDHRGHHARARRDRRTTSRSRWPLESRHVLEVAAGVTGAAMVVGAVITGFVVQPQARRVPAAAQPRPDRDRDARRARRRPVRPLGTAS